MARQPGEARHIFFHGFTLSILCAISYSAITQILAQIAQLRRLLCLPALFPVPRLGNGRADGIGAVAMALLGRPDDIIPTGITTAVVMVVAAISPDHAWRQPILRVVDTLVGVTVGVVGAWISQLPLLRAGPASDGGGT